jgi:hypothetical protein
MAETVNKQEIIESLVASGMSIEDAEAAYLEAFAPHAGGVMLPFPLLKVNNDATVATMGALVADPIRNEDSGDVEGYNEVIEFADVDYLILDRRAMWSKYDGAVGRTTVKTQLLDTFAKASAYVDSISGVDIATLKATDDDIKYQQLMLVGVRPKDSEEAFKFYVQYSKGAILYSQNQMLDTVSGSQYPVIQAVTKTSKKGSVKYTEFDLDKSVALSLPSTEVLKNVMPFLEAKTAFNNYVKDYNANIEGDTAEAKEAGLPE